MEHATSWNQPRHRRTGQGMSVRLGFPGPPHGACGIVESATLFWNQPGYECAPGVARAFTWSMRHHGPTMASRNQSWHPGTKQGMSVRLRLPRPSHGACGIVEPATTSQNRPRYPRTGQGMISSSHKL
uniref:Uncharacterized protein n=1 Tax=Nelumbo nucifera TaxID=4432 RepID=A0A822YK71_NELNU|nr:TPA_asm: hypothetical protein HUJ06_011758 [Nelumbo nucifera]